MFLLWTGRGERSVSAVMVPLWLARTSCVNRPSSTSQRRLAPARNTRWLSVERSSMAVASVPAGPPKPSRSATFSLWRSVKSSVTPGSSVAPPRAVKVPRREPSLSSPTGEMLKPLVSRQW